MKQLDVNKFCKLPAKCYPLKISSWILLSLSQGCTPGTQGKGI